MFTYPVKIVLAKPCQIRDLTLTCHQELASIEEDARVCIENFMNKTYPNREYQAWIGEECIRGVIVPISKKDNGPEPLSNPTQL